MSAIAGVFSRRGAPRRPGELDQMLTVMASRGPEGTHTWTTESIRLGHGALHATPEAVGEQMPLIDPLTGNVVVADVRLDNRSELLSQLGLDDRDPSTIGDGRVLLDAYRAWGEDCGDRLLGDFAFAIWDERRQQLFLARDHFGAKPLTYHSSEHLFAFASDSRSVVGLDDVPRVVSRDRVFDFLVDMTECVDTTSTFFDQVYRLPPAHVLTVSTAGQRLRRYWHLPEPEILRLRSDGEYEEATREILDLAVSCRLRGRDDVGVILSGGIDSSSIAALANRRGSASSYSAVSREHGCRETGLIRATTSALNLASHEVDSSRVRDLCGDYVTVHRSLESPFDDGAMLRSVFATTSADGRRSVLTGVLADEVVAISPTAAMRAFRDEGQPLDVLRLALSNGNLRALYGGVGLARSAVSTALRSSRWVDGLRTTREQKHRAAWTTKYLDDLHLVITPRERARLEERLDASRWTIIKGDGPGSLRHRLFDGGYAAAALERYDRTAESGSVEHRSPFMDRRVVQFFQSLPTEQLVSDGWSKSVLRRSMEGVLPDQIRWNRTKLHLGRAFNVEWLNLDPVTFVRDRPADHPLFEYVDQAALENGPLSDATLDFERGRQWLELGLWLDENSR